MYLLTILTYSSTLFGEDFGKLVTSMDIEVDPFFSALLLGSFRTLRLRRGNGLWKILW